jgi:DNA-binding response OmpR family regulator
VTTVVVVDDDLIMREILRALLEAAAFEVVVASDGEEGLARIAEVAPDAVMVDSQMPGMSGAEVVRRVRAGPAAGLAVVLMSGERSEAEVAAALDAGADHYLVKPFVPADVFAALEGALRVTAEGRSRGVASRPSRSACGGTSRSPAAATPR